MAKISDPFVPLVPPEKIHPNFRVLMEAEGWASAHGMIRELFETFQDTDGNFEEPENGAENGDRLLCLR